MTGDENKEKHDHKKELWQALKDESMPAEERIAKLEELKGHLAKKIEKIEGILAGLKQ